MWSRQRLLDEHRMTRNAIEYSRVITRHIRRQTDEWQWKIGNLLDDCDDVDDDDDVIVDDVVENDIHRHLCHHSRPSTRSNHCTFHRVIAAVSISSRCRHDNGRVVAPGWRCLSVCALLGVWSVTTKSRPIEKRCRSDSDSHLSFSSCC